MLGRLIIAALVVASAAFVMLQRQKSETVEVTAAVADTRASDAETRAADAEKRAKAAEERATNAEAKAAFFEAQLVAQQPSSAAADDPVAEESALHIKGARELADHEDDQAQLAVSLTGPATDITRISVLAVQEGGGRTRTHAWDTDGLGSGTIRVTHAGRTIYHPSSKAKPVFTNTAGAMLIGLTMPLDRTERIIDAVDGTKTTWRIEMTRADGKTIDATIKPAR